MAGRTTRSDSSMAIDALKDSDKLKIPREKTLVVRCGMMRWRPCFCFDLSGAVSWHIAARPEIEDAPTDGACAPGLGQI